MTRLEELTRGVTVSGILPAQNVTVIDTQWHGDDVIELTYKDANGQPYTDLLMRDREPTLALVTVGQPWSFDGDGDLLRLVSEAYRIRLAHLFDPMLAVHTSMVEPLPHQITAVYSEMLTRQPLRFLLADDPGAGKTIMAGLLIRELLIRGDLQRCLIVCPGSLAVQWQDELFQKFHLPFEILTKDRIESARTGNAFSEMPLLICRLDQLSRNDSLQSKLKQTDWDLIVCDEAHKMSASFFGKEVKETKRYKLGKLLGTITRHFLLMTATPHNGKEEDFQLFMSLLDSDRFEGRFRDGVHAADTSDLMRRMVKEELLKFDGRPLFPERIAHTVRYPLSPLEADLYGKVTEYVREEFNRADTLLNAGRKGTVGFALTILQRRLASSPEAIYQSLKRRREKLQKRLREEEEQRRNRLSEENAGPVINLDDWDDDFEDSSGAEREATEESVVDLATAASTIAELHTEIEQLKDLEELARKVRYSGLDRKWEELSRLLQDEKEMFDAGGHRRKLVLFTEHRDTLNYLTGRIGTLLGLPEAVVSIHGGMGRDARKRVEESFKQDVTVQVLVATDAAGEGINLQRAHLMVNYDLPWNPNRLEQRFGRIHRIGQTEVCHLWNLVSDDTREGDVYLKLLLKLDVEQKALGGKVFDVLGKAIAGKELRELLIEAIRYGDRPETKAKLNQVMDEKLDQDRLRELLEEQALAHDSMDASKLQKIREEMDRAQARRLQPHFIGAFFLEAFQRLGGTIRQREPKRYEISYVPGVLRSRDCHIGLGDPILRRYERISFDKDLIAVPGKPIAAFICPGHPLLDVTLQLTFERNRDLLKQGAVLVDESDLGEDIRVLVYLEHSLQDAHVGADGTRRVVSKRMQFVEIVFPADETEEGPVQMKNAGYAPYLDYRPMNADERSLVEPMVQSLELRETIEHRAMRYAITKLVPEHLQEVRQQKELLIDKTIAAVKDRLTKEINYWDRRASDLRQQEQAGKPNAKLNSGRAKQRADDLEIRMKTRLTDLQQERQISAKPPVVAGGALVVPKGLLERLRGNRDVGPGSFSKDTERVEWLAMDAVTAAEQALGYCPRDVSAAKCGYDIESKVPEEGILRFIEVKGRTAGARDVMVTRNEILTALNKPETFILALVEVPVGEDVLPADCTVRYVKQPFEKEPDWADEKVVKNWQKLWDKGTSPGRVI